MAARHPQEGITLIPGPAFLVIAGTGTFFCTTGFPVQDFKVMIRSPDGMIAFTELSGGTGTVFPVQYAAARSIRGIPDKEVNRVRITMRDERIVQALPDAGIIPVLLCYRALPAPVTVAGFPAGSGGYRFP